MHSIRGSGILGTNRLDPASAGPEVDNANVWLRERRQAFFSSFFSNGHLEPFAR
jgi:hypothetical protein